MAYQETIAERDGVPEDWHERWEANAPPESNAEADYQEQEDERFCDEQDYPADPDVEDEP